MSQVEWVTKRTHLQVTKTEVLPIIYKSRKIRHLKQDKGPTPRAFPVTEVCFSDSLDVIKKWITENISKMHRVGAMNVKPGSLEAPEVLQTGKCRFTVWFAPTAADFALMIPKLTHHADKTDSDKQNTGSSFQVYDGYIPTSQTLHVVAELDTDTNNT